MPKIGDPVDLVVRLEGKEPDKFIRARIFNDSEAQLASIILTHLSDGTYFDDSFLMPNSRRLIVSYDVFNDALLQELSAKYQPGIDLFDLDETDQALDQILSSLIQDSKVAMIEAVSDIQAVLEPESLMRSNLEGDAEIKASIETEKVLRASLAEEAITETITTVIEANEFVPLKNMKNGSGFLQGPFKAWAFLDDNTVTLADAKSMDLSENQLFDFAGISTEEVGINQGFDLIRLGRVPGALEGRGYAAGTRIFISDVAGEITDNPNISDPDFVAVHIGQAIPAVGASSSDEAKDLWVQGVIEA